MSFGKIVIARGDGDRSLPKLPLKGALFDPLGNGVSRTDVCPRAADLLRIGAEQDIDASAIYLVAGRKVAER